MKRIVVILFILFCLNIAVANQTIRLVKIHILEHDEVYGLNKYHITIVDAGKDFAKALVNDKEIAELRKAGYYVEILIDDYKAYKDEIFKRGFYHTYNQVYLVLDSFATNYSNICRLDTIGYSVLGRAIWAMRVTDNPQIEEDEPEIRLAGNMHGDEHIGTEITLYFLRHLLTNYASNSQVQDLINNREIWILPTLNPDGKIINSRYNTNGVDLNRDYGYLWDGWGGSPAPSSQIENQVMMQHLKENNISLEYNYHSTAFYVNYPWDYHMADPPDSQHIINLSQIYADSANLIAINGYDWYQVCGSLQDYTIGVSGALAWTVETDEPISSSAIDQICYNNRDALMDVCGRAGWGIEGVVKDSIINVPLYARIEIINPERIDVYTDPNLGDFHKMIEPGTYDLRISANGYEAKSVNNVVVPSTGSVDLGNMLLAPNPGWLYAFRSVVVRYARHAEQLNKTQPRFALGPNDTEFFSFGQGGFVVLDMGPNTPIINISGNDFTVYEGDDGVAEGYTVYASNNWNGPWSNCGNATGTADFDLSTTGLSEARYIRIVDDNSASSGSYAGFDLDAIKFFSSTTGLPAVPTIIKPLDFARLPDLQPNLTFSSIDPQGDDIQYRVLWDTDPDFATPDSATTATYPSGTAVNFVFPSPLVDDSTYWWKVKCTDPAGSGLWTQYANKRSLTIGTSLPESTCSWFQTTAAQFNFNNFNGTMIQGDSVILIPTGQTIFDTIFGEKFETGGIPLGWTVINGNGDTVQWSVGTTPDLGSYVPPDYGTGYAYYSDDDAGSSSISYNEELISPRIAVPESISNLEIVYNYGFRVYETGEKFRAKIRKLSGGSWSAWTNIVEYTSSGSGTEAVDLTSYLPADSVQFEWFYSDSTATTHWGFACACDNVILRYFYNLPNDYGTMTGALVSYHDLSVTYPRPHWGNAVWRKSTSGDSLGIQVEYYDGGGWQLVPDNDLPGNATGFYTNLTVDSIHLNTLDTLTYHTLRLFSLFYRKTTDAPGDPALLDWEVGNLANYHGITGAGSGVMVIEPMLRIYPTIFNRALVITYHTGSNTEGVDLKIYDASGRLVRNLSVNRLTNSLINQVVWDKKDDSGRRVCAGVYFVRLVTDNYKKTEKVILVR